jgi:hypothetical protein
MKRLLLLKLILLTSLLIPYSISHAQNITGIWRGNFFTADGSQYKFEVQLEQKGNKISGVSYSYLSTIFYGKATLTGNFSKASQKALVEEIKTVELRMSDYSVPCIMKCNFVYTKSGREEFLEGNYTSKFEKNSFGGKKGDDCGDGTVYLRRVTTSDFPVEPFLRNKLKPNTAIQPLKKDSTNTKIATTPIKKTPPPTSTKPPVKKPVTNIVTKPPVKKPVTNNTSSTNTAAKKSLPIKNSPVDSAIKIDKAVEKNSIPKLIIPKPSILTTRKNELVSTLEIDNDIVVVKIYDNGIIDDDTISVYYDNKLVLSKKRLTASALVINLKMDENNSDHELIMVAENLGRIPPNTSLMIVEAGDKRFDVRITSTEQKNAMVRFKYRKK